MRGIAALHKRISLTLWECIGKVPLIIAPCNYTEAFITEEEKQPPADREIPEIELDEETDAVLQAIIEDASDDVHGLVEIADIDPDAFAAFMKATGKQDDPTAKALLQAARDRKNEPKP
jgi:hypothetical protein